MHKGLHLRNDIDRLYVSRKDGGRRLMSCKSTIRSEENNFGWYLENSNENLLQEVKRVRILKFKDSAPKKDLKKLINEKRVENWKEKQICGQFTRNIVEGTDKEKSWLWMRKCDLKIPIEDLICNKK